MTPPLALATPPFLGDSPGAKVFEIGPHLCQIDGDMVRWQPRAEIAGRDAEQVCAHILAINARLGYALYLIDARGNFPVGYDARRVYARLLRSERPNLATAHFGGSMATRTAAHLLLNAARLFSGAQIHMRYFATGPEALLWLAEQRVRIRPVRPNPQ